MGEAEGNREEDQEERKVDRQVEVKQDLGKEDKDDQEAVSKSLRFIYLLWLFYDIILQ